MKKNLLTQQAAEQIVSRVKQLTATNHAQWGQMNVTEMLLHCNLCNEQIMEKAPITKKTTVKQYLLRILALYIAPHFKKGIHGDPGNDTKGRVDPLAFEQQKAKFIELVSGFPLLKQPLTLPHIAFGNITTKQWGIAAFKHMDHHLRQFGV